MRSAQPQRNYLVIRCYSILRRLDSQESGVVQHMPLSCTGRNRSSSTRNLRLKSFLQKRRSKCYKMRLVMSLSYHTSNKSLIKTSHEVTYRWHIKVIWSCCCWLVLLTTRRLLSQENRKPLSTRPQILTKAKIFHPTIPWMGSVYEVFTVDTDVSDIIVNSTKSNRFGNRKTSGNSKPSLTSSHVINGTS
jgi:hypothetical protein